MNDLAVKENATRTQTSSDFNCSNAHTRTAGSHECSWRLTMYYVHRNRFTRLFTAALSNCDARTLMLFSWPPAFSIATAIACAWADTCIPNIAITPAKCAIAMMHTARSELHLCRDRLYCMSRITYNSTNKREPMPNGTFISIFYVPALQPAGNMFAQRKH